jgi:acyl-CoA synthetase (AMP-forming)/AMP-acid ligase II
MYGAMRAGIVPVPLNTKLGHETLAYIIGDSGCRAAVIEPACNPFIAQVVEQAGIGARFAFDAAPAGWQAYEPALRAQSEHFEPPALSPDHMAFLPYTSGSTGRPKGVVLTHAGQLWWIRCVQKYWPSDSSARALAAVPLYHKNAMAGAIKPLLHAGGSVVILPRGGSQRRL